MYYPNLLAEMARRKVRQRDLAVVIGKGEQTVSLKMKGGFTLSEAAKIKEFLKSELSLDELFEIRDLPKEVVR